MASASSGSSEGEIEKRLTMADEIRSSSSPSSSQGDIVRKRKGSSDSTASSQSKRNKVAVAARDASRPTEIDTSRAGSSQARLGINTARPFNTVRRPFRKLSSPSSVGSTNATSTGSKFDAPVARKSAAGPGWRRRRTASSSWDQLKLAACGEQAYDELLLTDAVRKEELKRVPDRRRTMSSISQEVINLISDDEEPEPPKEPQVVATRPGTTQRRHTTMVDGDFGSMDAPIVISDSDDEMEIERSPLPEANTPPGRGVDMTIDSPVTMESAQLESSVHEGTTDNSVKLDDNTHLGEDRSLPQSISKPIPPTSPSTDAKDPSFSHPTLGILPSPTRSPKRVERGSDKIKMKGTLFGNSFFSNSRSGQTSSIFAPSHSGGKRIVLDIEDDIIEPFSKLESASSNSRRLSPSTTSQVSAQVDSSPENDDEATGQFVQKLALPDDSAEQRPKPPSISGSKHADTVNRLSPGARSVMKSLTEVINSVYSNSAQSVVDLTLSDDEGAAPLRQSSDEPPDAEKEDVEQKKVLVQPNPTSMVDDNQLHEPVVTYELPGDDIAEQDMSSIATPMTGNRSDVEMEDFIPRRTRTSKRLTRELHGLIQDKSGASSDYETRDTSADSLNLVPRRRHGKARAVSRTSSDTSEEFANSLAGLKITGMQLFTWKHDGPHVAKEFANTTMLAKDLPMELVDRLNALPRHARVPDMKRSLFKAIISKNTSREEPYAPAIDIVNSIDREATPAYEFYYTNLMWHSEKVPKPDLDALQGCGCRGICNPRTCACAKRQRQYLTIDPALKDYGFLYDKDKKLVVHGYPIFECNALCGCDDDLCQNRVVQNGRTVAIHIRKTPYKGWGVFAGADPIPANTFVGIYSGEFITDKEAQERGKLYNNFGRTYLFDLDFWYLKKKNKGRPKYCIDAYHAGNFTRYLNHSCDPNCVIDPCYINEPDLEKPLLTIFTCRDVAAGEELCFSYYGEMTEEELGKNMENDAVYAPCRCGARKCTGRMWK